MIVEIEREEALKLIERVARFVAERHMAPAAILFIESLKPLNRIGSTALYTVSPFVTAFVDETNYQKFAAMLEHREYVDMLTRRIEEIDEELHAADRKRKRLQKKQKRQRYYNFFRRLLRRAPKNYESRTTPTAPDANKADDK